MSSNFSEAAVYTIMGMGTVVVVLIFISLIISLFGFIPVLEKKIRLSAQRRAKRRTKGAEEPKAPKRPVISPAAKAAAAQEEMDPNQLIAVIMAAIVASEGGAVSADQLVVRSIRRVRSKR